jgi:hypothetical protein
MQRKTTDGMRRGSFKTGCLIAVGIVLALLVGGGIFVAAQWKNLAAAGINAMAEAITQQSDLPQDQKDRIQASIKGVAEDFKAGKISTEQLGKVMEEIAASPLLPVGIVAAAEEKYVKPSGLSQEEKDAGKRTMERFARGLFEKKIPEAEAQNVLEPISEGKFSITMSGQSREANQEFRLKDKVNDAELREFLSRAKAKVDEKQIADEAYRVDIAEELEKAINKALGK